MTRNITGLRASKNKLDYKPKSLTKKEREDACRLWRELKNKRVVLYWSKGLQCPRDLEMDIATTGAKCNLYNK